MTNGLFNNANGIIENLHFTSINSNYGIVQSTNSGLMYNLSIDSGTLTAYNWEGFLGLNNQGVTDHIVLGSASHQVTVIGSISNGDSYGGLFGGNAIESTISNVTVAGLLFENTGAASIFGGIVAQNFGVISNIAITGETISMVDGAYTIGGRNYGGVVGVNENDSNRGYGTLSNVSVSGLTINMASGDAYVGGVVGYN